MLMDIIHNAPLVSIIVPSYNHEKYIEECILSIVNQTYKNIELIVIDDGSKDRSPEMLRKLQAKYGFILAFQSNMGLSKTLNKALNLYAHGKYIAGSASDDYMVLDRIEKQVAYMESHPEYALTFGKVYMVDEASRIIEDFAIIDPVKDPVESVKFEALIESDCIPSGSVMLKRSVLDECGGYNENTIVEDLDLWLKISYRYKIAYFDEYLAYYRWHGANITTDSLKMSYAIWDVLQYWEDKIDPKLAKKILSRRSSFSFNILSRQYKKDALHFLKLNRFYLDGFVLKNYMKGFLKLLFYWKKDYKYWK
jgi:alpha-1,3-rhamnosyltransferase